MREWWITTTTNQRFTAEEEVQQSHKFKHIQVGTIFPLVSAQHYQNDHNNNNAADDNYRNERCMWKCSVGGCTLAHAELKKQRF